MGRRHVPRRRAASLLGILPLVLAGCFLGGLKGCVGENGAARIEANFESSTCYQHSEPFETFVSCPFSFLGSEMQSAELTLLTPAQELALLFIDPLIVQFPNSASNFSGTFTNTNPPAAGNLTVTTATCVNTAPGQSLCAEPGHKLVIFELPAGMETGTIGVQMDFTVNPAQAISVKPILTGKVTIAGATYYPVLIPCIASFADAPAVTVPLAVMPVDLTLPLDGVVPCTGTVDLRAVPALATPAAGHWTLLLLTAGLLAVGMRLVRRTH